MACAIPIVLRSIGTDQLLCAEYLRSYVYDSNCPALPVAVPLVTVRGNCILRCPDDFLHTMAKPPFTRTMGKFMEKTRMIEEVTRRMTLRLSQNLRQPLYVALTIMIAESRSEEKEMMISVIMNCLG